MQGSSPGLASKLEPHSLIGLLPSELLHLQLSVADPAVQEAQLPAVYKLAASPALRHADVLLAAHLGHSPAEQDCAFSDQADHRLRTSWVAPEAITHQRGLVLIPTVSCMLAARSPFFRALFSGRWRFALDARDVQSAVRLDVTEPGSSAIRIGGAGMAEVCLPVVRLSADAGAVLQLLHWMATGRMELLRVEADTASAVTSACHQCHQLRVGVMAASLAGEWLMDTAQDAAESVVVDSSMAADCCRRSVVETAYAVHMEGLAHRLTKRFWAQAEPTKS